MAELAKITTNTQRTWQSDSSRSSTSSSASRYNLDDEDRSPVLVYELGQGIYTKSQQELCALIDEDPEYRTKRVTKKTIPRFTGSIEVKQHDLYTPEERNEFKTYPNYNSFLAHVGLPRNIMLGRMLFSSYEDLYIISHETSPDSSLSGGVDSRKPSPSSTLSSLHDSGPGAQRE